LKKTKVLANTLHYYARLHRESIEIHKHQNNFNKKEESLKLNKTWFPAIRNRKITKETCMQSGVSNCRTSTNQSQGRATANETPGRYRINDVTHTISTRTTANLQKSKIKSFKHFAKSTLAQGAQKTA
jgi:hypothetical protein